MAASCTRAFPLLLLLLWCSAEQRSLTEARVVRGVLPGDGGPFIYLAKFCFVPTAYASPSGHHGITYTVHMPQNSSLGLAVYYLADAQVESSAALDASWDRVQAARGVTCSEKLRLARAAGENIFFLDPHGDEPSSNYPNRYPEPSSDGSGLIASGRIAPVSGRRRWLFLVATNCVETCAAAPAAPSCSGRVQLSYEITLQNGDGVERHFSADEIGTLLAVSLFFSVYSTACAFVFWWVQRLRRRGSDPRTGGLGLGPGQALLAASFIARWGSLLFHMSEVGEFSATGLRVPSLGWLRWNLAGAAESLMCPALLILSTGHTITRRRVGGTRTKVVIAMLSTTHACSAFTAANAAFVHENFARHETLVYRYESPSAVAHCISLGFVLIMLGNLTISSMDRFRTRRVLFYFMLAICVAWAVAIPLNYAVAHFLVPVESRALFLLTFELAAAAVIQGAAVALLWPGGLCLRPPTVVISSPPLSPLGAAGIEAASPSSSLPRSPGSFQSRKVEDPSHRYEGKLGPGEESRTKLEQVSLTRDPSERITALGNALRRRIAALEPWVAELDEVAEELRERQEERDDVALVDQ